MTEKTPYICYECDSEFFVFSTYEDETQPPSFCPYCGSELDAFEEDDLDPEEDEE
jgi:DNA-directed RNA polymerase subunit RPC12/RpoP